MDLRLLVVFSITVIFVGFYFWGQRRNKYRKQAIWKEIRPHLRSFAKKIRYQDLGPSGFKMVFPGEEGDLFERWEFTFTLLPRHILIHYIISKIRARSDRVIIKAQLRKRPELALELTSGDKVPREGGLKKIDVKPLADRFRIASSDPQRSLTILSNPKVRGKLERLGGGLSNILISEKQPNLVLVCSYMSGAIQDLTSLASTLGSKVQS